MPRAGACTALGSMVATLSPRSVMSNTCAAPAAKPRSAAGICSPWSFIGGSSEVHSGVEPGIRRRSARAPCRGPRQQRTKHTAGSLPWPLVRLRVLARVAAKDGVKAGIGARAQGLSARGVDAAGPTGNDLGDLRIGLPVDQRAGGAARDMFERLRHLAHGGGER